MTAVEKLGGTKEITEGILQVFREISRHPHASWHEKETEKDLAGLLAGMGLSPVEDEAGNLMADVPPTPGLEDRPLLILQGHMDMVCAVRPGSGFDPLADAPVLQVSDGFLHTDGRSSLGADNDLGNATVLWLLRKGIPHGPLRLLFTVAEEVGLAGAAKVSPTWLQGAWGLLNTDGFHYGRAIAGSAGGRRETYRRALTVQPCPSDWQAVALEISGGAGGHSGDDIHRGRLNAIRGLARFLRDQGCALADFSGGTSHNAIPNRARAVVVARPHEVSPLLREWKDFAARTGESHGESDPQLQFTAVPLPLPAEMWTEETARDVTAFAADLFNGVYAMHPRFPAVPCASSNLGKVEGDGAAITMKVFLRCARQEEEDLLSARHDETAKAHGFVLAELSRYPGWPGREDDPLVRAVCESFRQVEGREMEVSAVHVGLEPSVLGAKNPDMHMVSTGPDILDAHSVDERARLDTLPRYAALLAGAIASVKREA